MFSGIFSSILNNLLFLILHVSGSGTFPKPLSAKKEREYLELLQNGDQEAKNKLIEHNLRLVAHVIKKYYASTSDQDDLVSIGTIGLIKAINTFKPDKGTRLSSYAARCIENEVLMHFRNSKKSLQDVSMNEPIETDKDGNALTLMDTMAEEDSIIDQLDVKFKSEKLNTYMLNALSKREREIIKLRYGLCGAKPLTQREVAKKMNISRSYVSRIEKKALLSLRKQFEKQLLL